MPNLTDREDHKDISCGPAAETICKPAELSAGRAKKNVSIMCFHDELCQVYNALMTALNLLREGADVTVFFGSRGVNAVHKEKVKNLQCLPDQPKEMGEAVEAKMREFGIPSVEDLFFMLRMEGAQLLACPLNVQLFGLNKADFIDGVEFDNPATYYKEVVMQADMNLSF